MIDAAWMENIGQYESVEEYTAGDRDRALIIYTSGSTGRPKGIVHSHASFYEGVLGNVATLGFGREERLAAAAPLSFAVSLLEYFSVLESGGCIHILPEEVRRDVRLMETYYAEKDITCGFVSPQMLRYFKNRGKALKKIATGSERVSMIGSDGYTLYNLYGSRSPWKIRRSESRCRAWRCFCSMSREEKCPTGRTGKSVCAACSANAT